MTMFLMSMLKLASYWINLSVSYMERNSGMHTAMNVVFAWFFIWEFTFVEMSFIFYILVKILLMLWSTWSSDPRTPPILDKMLLNFSFNVNNLLNPFSKIFGKFKNLNVCPVGAVSNTITSNSIFSIELISCENDIASSIPGTELNISFNKVCVP